MVRLRIALASDRRGGDIEDLFAAFVGTGSANGNSAGIAITLAIEIIGRHFVEHDELNAV